MSCDSRTTHPVPLLGLRSRQVGVETEVPTRITLCSATLGEDGKTEPPLGPLYIAAAFERAGVEVEFRDFQLHPGADGLSGRTLAEFLEGHEPLVAISSFVDMLPAVIDASRVLKKKRPDTTILLGGPGPTAAARKLVERYPWVDAVVRGEGEQTVLDWVAMRRGGVAQPVAGMVYRLGSELIDGGERGRTMAIDAIPPPAYHLLDWNRYSHARVITTRGCSYRCSFCDVTALWHSRSVYRDLEATISEMEMLRDRHDKNCIAIVDDTFVLNRDRVAAFCRMLIERRSDIRWGCFGRINLMTPALMDLMREAGCQAVFYGIDSGSPAVLEKTVKRVRAADILPVLEQSRQRFDKIEASFIWGYPFETLADFRATLDVAAGAAALAPTVNVQLHMLSPLPLAPVYQEYRTMLVEPEPDDRPWLLLPPLLLDDRAGSLGQLIRDAPDVYPGFYTFRTPAKRTKRQLLTRAMRMLDRTIGRTLFDDTGRLLTADAPELERRLFSEVRHSADRIGVGLAVAFFRRARRRSAFYGGLRPFEGDRGPAFVRARPDRQGAAR